MLLEMEQITKKYGSFTANKDIHFNLREGRFMLLSGEWGRENNADAYAVRDGAADNRHD